MKTTAYSKNGQSKKIWSVGIIFTGVGILVGLILPLLFQHQVTADTQLTTGKIEDYEINNGGAKAEIFSYQTGSGKTLRIHNAIFSDPPSYRIGDIVQVYYNPDAPEKAWLKDNRSEKMMVNVFHILGVVFGVIGLTIVILKSRKADNNFIEKVGGAMGALAYGIPATAVLPTLYIFYLNRPNALFPVTTDAFSLDTIIFGGIFTITGIITLAGTFFLLKKK